MAKDEDIATIPGGVNVTGSEGAKLAIIFADPVKPQLTIKRHEGA